MIHQDRRPTVHADDSVPGGPLYQSARAGQIYKSVETISRIPHRHTQLFNHSLDGS